MKITIERDDGTIVVLKGIGAEEDALRLLAGTKSPREWPWEGLPPLVRYGDIWDGDPNASGNLPLRGS
jgi:hypothetical protein